MLLAFVQDWRTGLQFRKAGWEEALSLVAHKPSEIKANNGRTPSHLSRLREESYLLQKLARTVIGRNNMDNCQSPATVGLFRTVGCGGDRLSE